MIVVNSDKKEFRLFAGTGGGIYRGILLNHRCIGGVKIDKFWQSVLLYRQEGRMDGKSFAASRRTSGIIPT